MLQQIKTLESSILAAIPTLLNEDLLIVYRNEVLGKNGSLTELLK